MFDPIWMERPECFSFDIKWINAIRQRRIAPVDAMLKVYLFIERSKGGEFLSPAKEGKKISEFLCANVCTTPPTSHTNTHTPPSPNATCYQRNCKSLNALIRSPMFVTAPRVTTCHRWIRIGVTRLALRQQKTQFVSRVVLPVFSFGAFTLRGCDVKKSLLIRSTSNENH